MLNKFISIFDISSHQANIIFNIANIVLVIGSILVLLGTIAAVWTGGIRARFADGRISQNKADTAIANANAAQAQRDLEAERLERLKLEVQIAPRRLTIVQQQAITEAVKKFSGRKVSVTTYSLDAEGAVLGKQIISALQSAGIRVIDKIASVMVVGGFSLGIHITGSDQVLVASLSNALFSIGRLVVAPLNTKQSGKARISSGSTQSDQVSASILVGVKPITN